ncbi:squalene epoxidase-domain-containing protein, partial [Cladochytrium replicatum]
QLTDFLQVVIIGGGVVGAATAAALGRDGRKVLLIERDWAEPDRIVGELLQPGGIKALESLGLSASIEGIDGILTEGYAIMRGKETVVLKYPEDLSPRAGVAFHHGRFVTNLRRAALETRNVHGVQGIATELIKCPETNRVIGVRGISSHDGDLESGENQKKVYAPLTIAADGCFSRFRNEFVPKSNVEVKSHFAGLILTDCPLPHPNHGHVILAEPSPVLLYQIGSRDTRILVDIPGKVKINVSAWSSHLKPRYMRENVYPQLPEQIQVSFIEALESNGIRSMPNSWLPPTLQKQEGLILIGDAMNMRHPLTGGGMTVGLWDVVHIRSLLRQFPELSSAEPSKILLRMRTEHFSNRRPLASVINITAMGLYGMFAAGDDPQASILKETMFNYLKNGQKASFAPMGLLGGLIPSRYTLFVHFFAILF